MRICTLVAAMPILYFYRCNQYPDLNYQPMKKFYKTAFIPALLIVFFLYAKTSSAQCPNGQPAGGTAFDTTIRFPSGVTHKQIKFPKFDPQTGMLSCVKLIITMTGIIDTSAFENLSDAPINVTRSYNRSDNMAGPGLTPALSNSFNGVTNIPLGSNDGVTHAGPDFYTNSKDTVMRTQMVRTLTDSTAISAFYGSDSVVYDYDINVVSTVTAGGDIDNYMRTSAFVNFRFEYCTCPITTLPVGIKNFTVAKQSSTAAQLRWEAEAGNDNYIYEIEMSRDGVQFSKTAVVTKLLNTANPTYQQGYAIKANEYGRYYFRIKQRWMDGYYRYSEIRPVDLANPLFATISLYPNPSSGNIGIKFVSVKTGKFLVQVSNASGQVVVTKELVVAETDYKTVATLGAGLYYVKITDVATNASCVNQMIVK